MKMKVLVPIALILPFCSIASQAPGADIPLTITLQKRAAVGGSGDATFTPGSLFPSDVAADARGQFYVLDRDENIVRIHDANGKLLSTIGHRGKGPGEFAEPQQVGVTAEGAIVVSDNGKRAFVHFDARGKVLPEQSMNGLGLLQQILSVNANAMVVRSTVKDTDMVLRLKGPNVERLAILPPLSSKRPVPAFSVCGLRGSSRKPLLSPTLIAAANQNFVVTNQTSEFTIALYEPSGSPKLLKRNRQPSPLTPTLAREILGDSEAVYIGANSRRCAVPVEAIAKEAGLANVVPTYERLIVDRAGNIWALRVTPKDKAHMIDIYSATGGYRGTASIGGANPVAFLSDGAVLSLETDADDAPVIVVYAVRK
jgi:6-bladed beta-propeller protein